MSFEAKYRGRCKGCGESIDPGDMVRYAEDQLVHDDCDAPAGSADPVSLQPGEVVCGTCWLVKPCGCEDGL